MNKEHIISEIKRTAEENGGVPLGKDRFLKETGIKFSDWYGLIGMVSSGLGGETH